MHQDVDALTLGGDDLELALQDFDEVTPLLEDLVHADEAAHRFEIRRVDVEHFAVNLRRLCPGSVRFVSYSAAARSFVLAISDGIGERLHLSSRRISTRSRFCPRVV